MTSVNKIIVVSIASIFVLGIFATLPNTSVSMTNVASAFDGGGSGGSSGGDGGGGGFGGDSGCCSDGGGGYGEGPSPSPDYPVAKCISLTASRTTVPAGGANVTFTWVTQNALSASLSGVGLVGPNGSRTVFVDSNTTFTLTTSGHNTNDTCVVSIKVEAPKPPAKCVSLTASRTTVPAGGANVTFTWVTQNATSASLSGVGPVPVNGSRTIFVDSAEKFTLTAHGATGNNACAVNINVESVKPAAECLFLNASKTVVREDGETITLSWDTNNATSVSISGIGSVSESGSRNVFVNSNRTFTLTAVGTGGNDSCNVSITTKPVENKTPRCDYLRVSDDDVEEGDRVTLTWETTNADRVTITNIGNVSDDGSTTVTVYDDTTYTLRARNLDSGQEDTCSVYVRAEEEEDEDDDRKTPRCDLEISKDKVKRGEKVTLSWETTHVDDIRIRDDHGNTIFDTDDYSRSERKRYFDGSIDLIINKSTEFTMTVGGVDGGSRTCRVDVDVEDIAIYEKRDQGMVIALSQVPYTGFEAGSFLTFLFYAVLTLWALFVAYVLVIKKGAILGFSLYQKGPHISEADVEDRKKVEALVAKYAGSNWK